MMFCAVTNQFYLIAIARSDVFQNVPFKLDFSFFQPFDFRFPIVS